MKLPHKVWLQAATGVAALVFASGATGTGNSIKLSVPHGTIAAQASFTVTVTGYAAVASHVVVYVGLGRCESTLTAYAAFEQDPTLRFASIDAPATGSYSFHIPLRARKTPSTPNICAYLATPSQTLAYTHTQLSEK